MARDPRIDAYIERAAPFTQPILRHVRELVHAVCPEVEESILWGMAAFKQLASFGFWKHALVVGEGEPRDGMGSYGKMTALQDLPPDKTMLMHLRKAMQLNEAGVKSRARKAAPKPPSETPEDLAAALKNNKAAQATFAAFPPGCRREYIEWIVGARREDTRARRLAQAIEWMAEGKRRNWKYEAC